MGRLSIGQVAQAMGIQASTIRYYEKAGLLPTPERNSGRRIYTESIFDHLTFIHYARRAGFGISEIKTLVRGLTSKSKPGIRWRAVAHHKLADLDRHIEELEQMKAQLSRLVTCQCPSLRHFAADVREKALAHNERPQAAVS